MKKFKFFFITDPHYFAKSLGAYGEEYERFMDFEQKCYAETPYINDAVLEYLANSTESDTILIAGDLSFNGEKESHKEYSAKLRELKEKGKRIFVVTAGHDIEPNPFSYPGKERTCEYREGLYVGYRYYDKAGKAVRWPFGYGLSYTTFGYSDLFVENRTVTVTVSNTGPLPGAEVVQLYVAAPQDGVHRPLRELKGFQKVFLQPGQSKTVTFQLDGRSFALWQNGWRVPGGTYKIQIANLTSDISVSGEAMDIPKWQAGSWYETCLGNATQKEWETTLGKPYVPPTPKKGSFTMDNTVMEMKDHSLVMKIMFKATEMVVAKGTCGKVDYENPEFRMMINASAGGPLRSMQISGGIKGGIIPGMLEMANGHFFKGLWKMITG